MKKLILSLTILSTLSGCASMARMNYNEQCAVQGMKFAGVTQSNGTTYASAYNWQTGHTVSGSAYTSGEALSCVVAESEKDQCEVQRWQQIASPKAEYNSDYKTKYMLSGLGYWLFIVPGVAAKIAYDNQLSEAEKKSAELASSISPCGERAPASQKK